MEQFPPGAWDLARPSVTTWSIDLMNAIPTRGVNDARDKLYDLGKRIDKISRVIIHDNKESTEDEMAEVATRKEVEEPVEVIEVEYAENEEPVRICNILLIVQLNLTKPLLV